MKKRRGKARTVIPRIHRIDPSLILLAGVLLIFVGTHACAGEGFAPRSIISPFDSTFAHLADFDGDGDVDVIAGNENEDLSWFENTDGTGQSWETHVIDQLYSPPIAIGDLDGDGDLDIAGTVFAEQTGKRELVWWENTAGDASAWIRRPGIAQFEILTSLSFADLDKDGDLDVLISADRIIEWIENQSGDASSWLRQTIDDDPSGDPSGDPSDEIQADAVDLDGDGDLDVIALVRAKQVYWYENQDGLGTTWLRTAIPETEIGPSEAAYVDLDEDGDLDIVLGDSDFLNARTVFWLENASGDGSLWTERDLPVSPGENANFGSGDYLSSADVDHDGDPDIMIGSWDDCLVVWWENLGAASTWKAHFVDDIEEPTATRLGDFDGDGDLDILAASREDEGVFWFANVWSSPGIEFLDSGLQIIHHPALQSGPVAPADIDGDGDMDLITTNSSDDDVDWEENVNGDGSVWVRHSISGDRDLPRDVVGSDIDCDGDIDVLALGYPEISIWKNSDGAGNFAAPLVVELPFSGAHSMAVSDLDGDGDQDMIVAVNNSHGFLFYIENADGKGTSWRPVEIFESGASELSEISLADLDGDGDLDVLSTSLGNRALVWSENDGAGGTWTAHVVDINPSSSSNAAAADADGDGDLDIFAAYESGVSWWENSGTDAWEEHQILAGSGGQQLVRPYDFDRDGDVDLVMYDGQGKIVHYAQNLDAGSSWLTETLPTPSASELEEAEALELADFTGDGLIDICFQEQWNSPMIRSSLTGAPLGNRWSHPSLRSPPSGGPARTARAMLN